MEEFEFWDDYNVLPDDFIDDASDSVHEDNTEKKKKGHRATASFRENFMARINNQNYKHDQDGLRLKRGKKGGLALPLPSTRSVRVSSRRNLGNNLQLNSGVRALINYNSGSGRVLGRHEIESVKTSDSEDEDEEDLPTVAVRRAWTKNPKIDINPDPIKNIPETFGESFIQIEIKTPAKGLSEGHGALRRPSVTNVGGASWKSGGLGLKFGGGVGGPHGQVSSERAGRLSVCMGSTPNVLVGPRRVSVISAVGQERIRKARASMVLQDEEDLKWHKKQFMKTLRDNDNDRKTQNKNRMETIEEGGQDEQDLANNKKRTMDSSPDDDTDRSSTNNIRMRRVEEARQDELDLQANKSKIMDSCRDDDTDRSAQNKIRMERVQEARQDELDLANNKSKIMDSCRDDDTDRSAQNKIRMDRVQEARQDELDLANNKSKIMDSCRDDDTDRSAQNKIRLARVQEARQDELDLANNKSKIMGSCCDDESRKEIQNKIRLARVQEARQDELDLANNKSKIMDSCRDDDTDRSAQNKIRMKRVE
jgi:hypothetical protein